MKIFETNKNESSRTKWARRLFNIWPCIFCSGGKVTFIAEDFTELHVQIKLGIRTRNRVGTVYGGSIYSSIDPHYMIMFMEILGKNYVVWDKGATIKFIRPITHKAKCRFLIDDATIQEVKQIINEKKEHTFEFPLYYEDDKGNKLVAFNKSVYIADKEFYKKKIKSRA